MPVKIRLMRIGAKKRPFYRVVAVDERKKRTGAYLELLGTYNPLTNPKEILLKQDRIEHWLKNGAVQSDGFLRIIGKAPQIPPRKPKRDKGTSGQGTGESTQVKTEEPVNEEVSEVKEETVATQEETPIDQSETVTEAAVETPTEAVEPVAPAEGQEESAPIENEETK